MPITYNPKTKRYEQDGEPIEPSRIAALISKLVARAKIEAKRITKRYADGAITYEKWYEAMVSLIESAQIVAASVGRGGRELVENWGKVADRVEWQSNFLPRFGRDIASEKLSEAQTANRAGMYADASYVTYQNEAMDAQKDGGKVMARLITNAKESCEDCSADEAEGWMPIEEMGEIGSRICGDFCKCQIEFSDDDDGSSPDFTEAAVNLVFGVSE